MTLFSRRQTDELKWVSVLLFLAALYNVVWGGIAAIAPVEMLAFVGISSPRYAELWQCIGMFVALYGVGYWFASTDPVRYWPFVLIGLLGKVLGPIGAVFAIFSGRLPPAFAWVNVTNDFVWWAPFVWALWVIHRWNVRMVPVARDEHASSLYHRVIGPAFDDLTPRLRHFHDARQPIEVRGIFNVTRGDTTLGNWLTDRVGVPRSQKELAVSLVVEPTAAGEIWRRSFAGTLIESWQFEAHGFLAERFGPLVIFLQPRVVKGALEITDARSTLLGLPLPPFLTPNVWARGIDNGAGIDIVVRISCSPFGVLVEYKGNVALVDTVGTPGMSSMPMANRCEHVLPTYE